MTENSRRISKNNRGFSLVELIIVIAIIAALIGTVILSVSMVFSANAKACSNDLQRAVADCKVTTMGKAKAGAEDRWQPCIGYLQDQWWNG